MRRVDPAPGLRFTRRGCWAKYCNKDVAESGASPLVKDKTVEGALDAGGILQSSKSTMSEKDFKDIDNMLKKWVVAQQSHKSGAPKSGTTSPKPEAASSKPIVMPSPSQRTAQTLGRSSPKPRS